MTAAPLTIPERVLWRGRDLVFAPPAAAGPDGTIVVAGLFRAASGMGRAARALADAIAESGRRVVRVDLSADFGQLELPPPTDLSAMPRGQRGTLALVVNAPETDRALLKLRHFRPKQWRLIGLWLWETTRAPQSWRKISRRFSEIWAPSRFVADALGPIAAAPVRLTRLPVKAPAEARADRVAFGLEDDALVCLAMADGRSSFHRKNPVGAVHAFRQGLAGVGHARLIVKLRNADDDIRAALATAAAGDPRIRLFEADLTESMQWRLTASADIVLSLHRAEGLGLPIAEALALGKSVVATGWSGNMDFMTAENSMPVAYALAPVSDPTQRYAPDGAAQWAEPDVGSAAQALRRLVAEPQMRARIEAAASQSAHGLAQAMLPFARASTDQDDSSIDAPAAPA